MIFIDRMRALLFLALVMMIPVGDAWAQTACPTGVAAGSAQCGPSPQGQGGGAQSTREVWVDNWYSYAVCTETGTIGLGHTFDTRDEARRAALGNCRSNGGTKCVTAFVESNRCFSITNALGDDPILTVGGNYSHADTLQQAEDMGIGACMRAYPGKKCVVYYSMCNYRERVR